MGKGWNIHGAVMLPEIREIVREELVEDEYIASKLLPEVYVDAPMAKIRVIAAGQDKRLVDSSRAFNGSYSRIKWAMGTDQYDTDVYGIEVQWDNNEALANESVGVNEQSEAGLIATGTLKTGRENRVSAAFFNVAAFTAEGNYSNESNTWDGLTPDALNDRITVGQKVLFTSYGLRKHHLTLVCHPDLVDKLANKIAVEDGVSQTVAVKLMTQSEQAEVVRKRYGLKEIVLTTAPYNDLPFSAGEEDEANFKDIYPRDKAILGVLSQGNVGFKGAGLGWQPVYAKATKDFEIEQYAEPGVDGQVIRAKEWRGTKVRPQWGYLFDNVLPD